MALTRITSRVIGANTISASAIADGSITSAKLASGAARANMGSGTVLQVVQKIFGDVTTTTSVNTFVDVTNGYLAITPVASNSKFLVRVLGQGYQSAGAGMNLGLSRVIGGTTTRLLGTDGTGGNSWMGAGNGPSNTSYTILREYLDSPNVAAGTPVTYKMLVALWSGATAVYLNYSGYSPESMITIEEIAG